MKLKHLTLVIVCFLVESHLDRENMHEYKVKSLDPVVLQRIKDDRPDLEAAYAPFE